MPSARRVPKPVGEAHRLPQRGAPSTRPSDLAGSDDAAGQVGHQRRCAARRSSMRGRLGAEGVEHRARPAASGTRATSSAAGLARRRARAPRSTARTASPSPEITTVVRRRSPRRSTRRCRAARGAAPRCASAATRRPSRRRRQRLHQRARARRPAARPSSRLKHAGDAGRRVLADAVAEHGRRLDAPGPPQLGQRVLEREQRRLGVARSRRAPPALRRPNEDRPAAGGRAADRARPRTRSSAARKTGSVSYSSRAHARRTARPGR